MSRAFAKEFEEEWLGDVAPDVRQLELYLTRKNGGLKVTEIGTRTDRESGRTIHEMSDGECYMLDDDDRWKLVL